jgi:hypothetical protein
MILKFSKPLIIIVALIVVLGIAGALVVFNQDQIKDSFCRKETEISSQEVAQRAISFINENLLPEGMSASLLDVSEESGLYKIHFKIADQEYDSYLTKDGNLLFPEGISLSSELSIEEPSEGQGIGKREKPDVKLFVMSYCPFGLQAQKMFLPVYNLLKGQADMGIYFVNYIMHEKKEIDENLRQYCIQKEQGEKFADYLECFVADDDFEGCLLGANIDQEKMESCILAADEGFNITAQYNDQSTWLNGRFPKFDVHTDLNEQYGIGGSPTVVINDQIVQVSPRSPENFKGIVCDSFVSPPPECSQALSQDAATTGFGLGAGSSSGGSCE